MLIILRSCLFHTSKLNIWLLYVMNVTMEQTLKEGDLLWPINHLYTNKWNPHRSRRCSRSYFGFQWQFQCHMNCQGVGFQKIWKLKKSTEGPSLVNSQKTIFYWDSSSLNQLFETFMINSHYLGSHRTKNLYILFLALIPKKLEFTIWTIINQGPSADFFKFHIFWKPTP